jgi:hypothetical protein
MHTQMRTRVVTLAECVAEIIVRCHRCGKADRLLAHFWVMLTEVLQEVIITDPKILPPEDSTIKLHIFIVNILLPKLNAAGISRRGIPNLRCSKTLT